MDMLSELDETITATSQEKIQEFERETEKIQKSNPYKIPSNYADKGFIATDNALYRSYSINGDYYLKISRDSGNKFKLNYAWCRKIDASYNVVTEIFTSTKTIYEDKPKRNKLLGKYTKDYNIPRDEREVAEFLDETWQLIFNASGYFEIFKDASSEYTMDKYSSTKIMHDYMVLSDTITDNGSEFRLLYVKNENYNLFIYNNDKEYEHHHVFNWQDNPVDILKLDATDDKIILLAEKLHSINPRYDVEKIKDSLFKSIVEIENDYNKKVELLNNASSRIKEVIIDNVTILRAKHFDNLNQNIKEKLSEHKAPTIQMLADYINLSDEFFIVHSIKKRFKRTKQGFIEITVKDISNYFNNEFGFNKISMRRCEQCMDYITRELTINYDILQFRNGLYNTLTGEFIQDKFASEYIPKINLSDYSYVEDAESKFKATKLYKENHEILKTDRKDWEWNEDMYYKSIGSCYHATNVAEKMFIIVGKSWSRKSTLLTIIKKIFDNSYCNLKVQQIVKNDRFELVPTVNKAILIDDDASDLQIKNIGNLNSFITGTGLYVEFKNMNDGVYLDEYNTPRIWTASNELFNVIGSGFKRRLCLILADNEFDRDDSSKHYMIDIKNGERDKELELLISYSLQLYESEKDKSFLTKEQEDTMYNEFEFKSYPERRFIQDVFLYADELAEQLEDNKNYSDVDVKRWSISFKDNSDVENVGCELKYYCANGGETIEIPTIIPKKDATIICRKYLRYQKEQETIFDSQVIPSSKKIKTAMEMFGFNQTKKNISVDSKRTSIDVFENIIIKSDWIYKLGINNLVMNIKEETGLE